MLIEPISKGNSIMRTFLFLAMGLSWVTFTSTFADPIKIRSFVGCQKGMLNKIVLSPTGRLVASSASNDEVVRVYSTIGPPVSCGGSTNLQGKVGFTGDLAFSPDEALIATANSEPAVRIWFLPSGAPAQVGSFRSIVSSISFSPNRTTKTLFVGESDGSANIWNLESDKIKKIHTGANNGPVASSHFASGGALVFWTQGHDFYRYDLPSEREEQIKFRDGPSVWSQSNWSPSPDGKLIFGESGSPYFHLWKATGEILTSVVPPPHKSDKKTYPLAAYFLDDGNSVIVQYGSRIATWDLVDLFAADLLAVDGVEFEKLSFELFSASAKEKNANGRRYVDMYVAAGDRADNKIDIWNVHLEKH